MIYVSRVSREISLYEGLQQQFILISSPPFLEEQSLLWEQEAVSSNLTVPTNFTIIINFLGIFNQSN